MYRIPLFGSLLFLAAPLRAQEQFGIANSNYAGTDAVPMNPARMATHWSWMDLNILGAGAFVWNDHVYLSGRDRSILGEMRESIRSSDGDRFTFNESLRSGARHGFVNAHAALPSIALNLGLNSIGAHVRTRAAVSLTGIGNDIARFAYNGLDHPPQHGIRYQDDRLRIALGAWTEFGASYARLISAHDFTLISGGITAKYILAHAGGGLAFSALDYTVLDTARMDIHEASGMYGLATPAIDAGRGFGFDIGAVYERTLESADGYVPHQSCDPMPYQYRIGLSLLDVGGMKFKDAMSGTFEASTANYPDYSAIDLAGEEGLDSLLSATLSTFERTSAFRTGLPTALAAQFDYRVVEHAYVAVNVVQNLAFGDNIRLRRPNSLALVPRYELQRLEVAMPVVLHEYDLRRPSFGLMLRLNSIVLGSDNLLSLFTRGGLYGTDAYFRIKWTIFRSPVCRGKKSRKHRAGDGNAMPCVLPE